MEQDNKSRNSEHTVVIGLTTYPVDETGKYAIPSEYVDALRRAGAAVLMIPSGEKQFLPLLQRIDGLVLSGGGDIEPGRYGGDDHETIYNLYPERDEMELAITQWILANRMPTLAICRGLQIINVACGGTLHEHIPDALGETVAHRVPPRDPVDHEHRLKEGSRLHRVMGATTVTARSWHHQSVDQPADGFIPVAWAPDGCIEAIEHPDRPELIAIQWHPELSAHKDQHAENLFKELVSMAANR